MNATADFSIPFQAFGADLVAAAIHQQDLFNAALGAGYRSVDLDTRRLTGEGDEYGGVSLLGSVSFLDNTWLWGWANPGFGPGAPAVAPTLRIRAFGEQYGIPELTQESPDLSGFPNPAQAATILAMAAGTLLGGHGVWSTGINDGQGLAFVHVDDDRLPTATFDLIATPRLLTTGVSVFPADHRRVVSAYLDHFRIDRSDSPAGIEARTPDGGTLRISFDHLQRLANVAVRPPG